MYLLRLWPGTILLSTFLLLANIPVCFASYEEPSKLTAEETAAKIVAGIKSINKLFDDLSIDQQSPKFIKERLEHNGYYEDLNENSIFGLNRIDFHKNIENHRIHVILTFFNQDLATNSIAVTTGFSPPNAFVSKVDDLIKKQSTLLNYRNENKIVLNAYHLSVAKGVGEMLPVTVPDNLKDTYQFLVSDLNNSVVGGDCSIGGKPTNGKISIDLLITANRIDLIENVLRGYSPGGRIHAVRALLKMQAEGFPLSKETKDVIVKIKKLSNPIESC